MGSSTLRRTPWSQQLNRGRRLQGIQSLGHVKDALDLEPFGEKWRSFGWQVEEIDGHDPDAIWAALSRANSAEPRVIIARTIKDKGGELHGGSARVALQVRQ